MPTLSNLAFIYLPRNKYAQAYMPNGSRLHCEIRSPRNKHSRRVCAKIIACPNRG